MVGCLLLYVVVWLRSMIYGMGLWTSARCGRVANELKYRNTPQIHITSNNLSPLQILIITQKKSKMLCILKSTYRPFGYTNIKALFYPSLKDTLRQICSFLYRIQSINRIKQLSEFIYVQKTHDFLVRFSGLIFLVKILLNYELIFYTFLVCRLCIKKHF